MEKFCKDCNKRVDRYCTYLEKYVPKKYNGKENLADNCKKYQPKKVK